MTMNIYIGAVELFMVVLRWYVSQNNSFDVARLSEHVDGVKSSNVCLWRIHRESFLKTLLFHEHHTYLSIGNPNIRFVAFIYEFQGVLKDF